MPFMNGEFYFKNSTSVQRRIDLVNAIEKASGGITPAWQGVDLDEVEKDIRRGLKPVSRRFRNSRHLRGGFYDSRKSPRNLKRRHFMASALVGKLAS